MINVDNNRRKLINEIKEGKGLLGKWFEKNNNSDLNVIINDSISGSTFRSLKGKPSKIFRRWAEQTIPREIDNIKKLASQQKYDEWLKNFSDNLGEYWANETKNPLLYSKKRKLTDLLMKRLLLWEEIKGEKKRLMEYLHVPLDKYILIEIRKVIKPEEYSESIGKISKNPSMGNVVNKEMYDSLQNFIRAIVSEAAVPPIYLDIWVWDRRNEKDN